MNKKILHLAIPNILSNISIPLLSSVDTAVMGHLDSPVYLGAIALGSIIFNFIYWGFGFLRMGTTGLTAQAIGANNNKEVSAILARSLFISIFIGLVLIVLQFPISQIGFYLINGSKDVEFFAKEYFYIRIFAAPATLSLYAFHGWFLGVQNAKYPLYVTLLVNVLNIILNLIFVFEFGMKADGVALGTVISQYIGVLFSLLLIKKSYKNSLNFQHFNSIFQRDKFEKFFKVNLDIFLRTLLLIFTISFFTAKSAEMNDIILAANFILMQLWMIIAYGVDGFAFAAESLVGKYIGSRDNVKLKMTIKFSFLWGISLGIFVSIIYLIFGREILELYSKQQEVIEAGMNFLMWIIISPIINSVSFIWDGIYFGATETRKMLYSMIFSTIFVFLPVYFLTKDLLGNHSIWMALVTFMIFRGFTLSLIYFKKIKPVIFIKNK
ncbi:MAG: MATE family efflux transporter [Ignavibacteriae bacterium]|nr:MATE family efflux transporter [Ignavibacteriota bacterium]MCB9206808.1 MATE family efflux transporter [Ignavibacteriales bacterium]MCB9210184.1 MATE family efflux transporter [Ignavibacteriales bacterium]MCB9218431.1 MATE family efflux transporter [Ignavibacteriales bacterium]MCB9259563.1 MATE family efflux transporter [Ignavibacteriales bacterium]